MPEAESKECEIAFNHDAHSLAKLGNEDFQNAIDIHSASPAMPQPTVELLKGTETVIIFDWDDTLLASTFLASKGYRLDNTMHRCPLVEAQLRQLERSACNAIELALRYGPVHIVTNAEAGWVQLSAQQFIPAVVPLLEKVSILSARSTFEAAYPNSPLQWKLAAFQQKLGQLNDNCQKNVISFGDSHVEREAVRCATKSLPRTRTKSVKFAERPSMEQLHRQLELIVNCFQRIYSHPADLDLMLTISIMG